MRALLSMLVVMPALCASGLPLSAQVLPRPVTAPADYRRLAAEAAQTLSNLAMPASEISELRPTQPPQLDDWYACMRTAGGVGGVAVAVFFRDGKVSNMRRAVVIDNCAQAAYGPLAPPPKPEEPPPRRAKKRAKPAS